MEEMSIVKKDWGVMKACVLPSSTLPDVLYEYILRGL